MHVIYAVTIFTTSAVFLSRGVVVVLESLSRRCKAGASSYTIRYLRPINCQMTQLHESSIFKQQVRDKAAAYCSGKRHFRVAQWLASELPRGLNLLTNIAPHRYKGHQHV